MVTLSISPKIIKKGELIVIPKREYDELVRRASFVSKKIKINKKWPAWLKTSMKDVKEGRLSGPFETIEELRASLES